jgi:hypothetical protein
MAFDETERFEEITIAVASARGYADLLRMALAKFVQPPSLTMRWART